MPKAKIKLEFEIEVNEGVSPEHITEWIEFHLGIIPQMEMNPLTYEDFNIEAFDRISVEIK